MKLLKADFDMYASLHLPQMFQQFTLQTAHLRTGPDSG